MGYDYDAVGNRLVQNDGGQLTTSTYDAASQLVTETALAGVTSYLYDADGNRSRKESPTALTLYDWDEDNRLITAQPPAGDVGFQYNALGQRVEKEVQSSGETRKFIYDMTRLLMETDDAGDTERAYTATIQEYGDLVSEYDEGSGQSAFHQYDALGSTDALLDADETATDRYQYRAFGLATHETGTSDSPFTFVGKQNYYRDPELELYYLGMGGSAAGGSYSAAPSP